MPGSVRSLSTSTSARSRGRSGHCHGAFLLICGAGLLCLCLFTAALSGNFVLWSYGYSQEGLQLHSKYEGSRFVYICIHERSRLANAKFINQFQHPSTTQKRLCSSHSNHLKLIILNLKNAFFCSGRFLIRNSLKFTLIQEN